MLKNSVATAYSRNSQIGRLRRPLLALRVWRWHKIRWQMLYVKLSREYGCPKHNKVLNIDLHRAIKFVFWPTFWFISYIEEKFSYIEEHISTWKKSFHADFFFIFASTGLQPILLAVSCCKNSKTVLRFQIGPWKVGKKLDMFGHTDRQIMFHYVRSKERQTQIFVNHDIDTKTFPNMHC